MQKENAAQRGQTAYIIQAALEHLVALLVSGSFLATLTKELGFSDGLTGIVSSIISLGCLFQLLTVFVRRRIKTTVIGFSFVCQILFLLLYVIPLTGAAKPIKTVLFVGAIVLAYLIYNLIHPQKTNWLMGTVGDGKRGVFTATKEMVSLAAGIGFSFGMGELVDYFAARGQIRTAFLLCAIVIFVLMMSHALSLFFVPAQTDKEGTNHSIKNGFSLLLRNKNLRAAVTVSLLYNVAAFAFRPFLGSYNIKELGFSLGFVAVLSTVSSVSRIAVSRQWGRYADRRGFAAMVEKCLLVLGVSWVFMGAASPSSAKWMFIIAYVFSGAAMGGINSAMTNLIYDYVPRDQCADAIAVTQAISGVAGFLTTLLVSPLVTYVQSAGNRLFGIPMYAQQVLAIIGVLVLVLATIFTRMVLIRKKGETA